MHLPCCCREVLKEFSLNPDELTEKLNYLLLRCFAWNRNYLCLAAVGFSARKHSGTPILNSKETLTLKIWKIRQVCRCSGCEIFSEMFIRIKKSGSGRTKIYQHNRNETSNEKPITSSYPFILSEPPHWNGKFVERLTRAGMLFRLCFTAFRFCWGI